MSPRPIRWRLDASGLDPATVEREKALLAEKNAGKPADALEKIIDLRASRPITRGPAARSDRTHPDHGGKTITQTLKEHEGKAGAPITIKGFARYALGEGIEKETSDFAAEVAAAAKGSSLFSIPGRCGGLGADQQEGEADRWSLRLF